MALRADATRLTATGPNDLALTLWDAYGRPVDSAAVEVQPAMEAMRMEVPVVAAQSTGTGRYVAHPTFGMAGSWRLKITITPRGGLANMAATWFGVILLVVGILGFVPGITQMNSNPGYLLGLFAVDGVHNIVHILTGIVALAAGLSGRVDYARMFFLVFGIVYALVTVIGFIQGTTVLGIFAVNIWDNLLHVAITAVSFAVYFATGASSGRGSRSGADATLAALTRMAKPLRAQV